MTSSSRSLLTTNAVVVITLVVGFVNNIAIAAIFGLTRQVDAFYAAQMLPNLFMVLCVDYLGKNFLPTFARAKAESERLAAEIASSIVTIMFLAASAVAVVLALASTPLFDVLLPGFSAEDVELVTRYFWIMAPALVLMTITAFHQYVCQYDEQFVRISAIQAALPLSNLAAIVLASPLIGEYALPVGYLIGQVVVFVLMARQARYRYSWRTAVRKDWEGRIFSNSAIVMGSGLVARTRMLIVNYLASLLGGGAISALALASRLTEPLGRTMFMAVRMLMFSRTARFAVDGNSKEIARLHDIGLSASFLLLAPLLWWIGLNSDIIVEVLFVRGEFDLRMASLVSLALIGAVPSILFNGVNALMSNAFYAMNRIAVPALVMPLGVLIHLAVAPPMSARYGVLGLTVTTSLATAAVFVVLAVFLSRQVPHFGAMRMLRHLLLYTGAAGLAFGLPAVGLAVLEAPRVATAAVSLAAGLSLYLLVLLALRDPMLAYLYQYVRKAMPAQRVVRSPSG